MAHGSAPGKIILCGEHAVVYGRPAIALPLLAVRARADVIPAPPGAGVSFDAPDLGRRWSLADAPDDPLSELLVAALRRLGAPETPDLQVRLTSDVPIAGGMGSGAALATALVRALAAHYATPLESAAISELVYASERRYHGTPSGIDNTVVAFERAVWYVRAGGPPAGTPPAPTIEPLRIGAPLQLLIGDTGLRSATRLPVGEVRRRREEQPERYDRLFDEVAEAVVGVRAALAAGDVPALGRLLDGNQALLEQIGVSAPELERLIHAARAAGALGAKLSGAGWGGVMLALVTSDTHAAVAAALREAGAARVLATEVAATS